jgi:hypothetical protein
MTINEIFSQASAVDDLVRVEKGQWAALENKRILPVNYSRDTMFTNMASGQVSLFCDFPVNFKEKADSERMEEAIRTGFPKVARARTQNGPAKVRKYLSVHDLMDKWKRSKGIVSVTDLHFRDTLFEQRVNADPLSDFNIYCHHKDLVRYLEMMTMVISSKGNVTETHSDDSDGTNHCFMGVKLWLVWDRLKGKKQGLQDATYDNYYGAAHFSISDFLKTEGSQWFLVGPGETLFLPGNLTHRVITLESYIGIGSFYVALPSYIRSLYRWIMTGSTDVTPELLNVISKEVVKKVKSLAHASSAEQIRYGYHYLENSLERFHDWLPAPQRKKFMEHHLVQSFLKAVALQQAEPAS